MDIDREDLISMRDAAAIWPGGMVHWATVYRWANKGLKRGGAVLETVMIGGRRMTSREALLRFIKDTNGVVINGEAQEATPHKH